MERMKNQNLFLMLTLVLMSMFFVSFASADASVDITTTNNTEFNTLTPTINVNVTWGNCTSYFLNVTAGGTIVVNSQVIVNATDSEFTTSALTAGTNYNYTATVWNATCCTFENTSADYALEVNAQPSLTTVTQSTYGNLLVSNTLTWTNVWVDQNSTGTDNVTVYLCKTDAFTTSCTGGEWGSSNGETDNSTTASYTILTSDTAGLKNYYVYLLDDNSYASSSTSGTFTVSRPIEDEDGSGAVVGDGDVEGDPSKFQWGYVVIAVVIAGALYLVFKKK